MLNSAIWVSNEDISAFHNDMYMFTSPALFWKPCEQFSVLQQIMGSSDSQRVIWCTISSNVITTDPSKEQAIFH